MSWELKMLTIWSVSLLMVKCAPGVLICSLSLRYVLTAFYCVWGGYSNFIFKVLTEFETQTTTKITEQWNGPEFSYHWIFLWRPFYHWRSPKGDFGVLNLNVCVCTSKRVIPTQFCCPFLLLVSTTIFRWCSYHLSYMNFIPGLSFYCLQDSMELQFKQSKAVAVTCLSFLAGDVNNFVVGSEEGSVYTACRHGR